MGRNAAIKHFDTHPDGQPVDLFDSVRGRLPVVLELLKSPWIVRGSELVRADDAASGKRTAEEVAVGWDGTRRAPASFAWRGKRYRVDALVQTWAVERWWWDRERRVSRRCFRVLARGGVYDLAFDRIARAWLLVGVVD
jgi:hypothetical protein